MPKPTFFNLPEAKRQRIIDAAVEVLGAAPYAQATLDEIVRLAGISKGSMYQYFEGKADLFRWLITDYMGARKMASIGAGAPGPDASLWEVLEAAFISGVRFSVAEPGLTRLGVRFMRDAEQEPELAATAEETQRLGRAWVLGLLTEGQRRGELRKDVDLQVAAALFQHALGVGMLELMAARLGLSLSAYLASPEATERLSEAELRGLVRTVLQLFRDGVSP
ncbi:MAG: TetR/AcrR family transcriptional regulator [Alphaproteobacteria bacterium]|nr:TetR/AcrR family transcriptional regulator [Alphaproteobacteria bacterium]